MKQIGVGLLGFGTVGAGVVAGLQRNRALLSARLGVDVVVRTTAIRDDNPELQAAVAAGLPVPCTKKNLASSGKHKAGGILS